jgi:hypothetical protein
MMRQMGMGTQAVLAGQVEAVAKAAGLVVISSEVGPDFSGHPTTRFMLALVADNSKKQLCRILSGSNRWGEAVSQRFV